MSLIPEGLSLPSWYAKKIYFYLSDIVAPFLFFIAAKRHLRKELACLFALFFFAFLSLFFSPLSHYPLPYFRLFQLATPFFLFTYFAGSQRKEPFLWALWWMALFQSCICIGQYVTQKAVGLRLLGEPPCIHPIAPAISTPGASLWLFDFDPTPPIAVILRSVGTLPHPNVLGGFVMISLLSSAYFLVRSKRPLLFLPPLLLLSLALFTSFSRSALFGWAGGSLLLFLFFQRLKEKKAYLVLVTFFSLTALNLTLFWHQYLFRGGVVNYNVATERGDAVRLFFVDAGLSMIQDHPWLGAGYNQFSYVAFRDYAIDIASGLHNIYLLLAAETGLLSLGIFFLFLSLLLYRLPRTPLSALLTVQLLALLWVGCVDFYPLLFHQGALLLFTIAGLLAGQKQLESL